MLKEEFPSWNFRQKKTHFLDILEIFSPEMGQISSDLLKKTFATWQHAFISTSTTFYDIFARVCVDIKISSLGGEVAYVFRLLGYFL